jgi:organic radical activating enzyme
MSELVGILPERGRFANITWQVSDVCNFRCSYCNEGNWGGNSRNLNVDRYLKVVGGIIDHFQDQGFEAFKFFFSGGEPTVWPPLIPILEYIYSRVERPLIAVNTNLSRPLSWWEKNYHLIRDVVASFHVEFTRKETYMENMKFLQYRMPYVACRLLMHDERFSEVVDFSDRLKAELDNYFIEYAALIETLSPHSPMHHYKEEWKRDFLERHTVESRVKVPFSRIRDAAPASCRELFSDGSVRDLNSNRIVSEDRNRFKGWKCWVADSIFITPNGNVKLASCNAGKGIGNINEGELAFESGPVICPEDRCNCGTDIGIRKLNPNFQHLLKSKENA